MHEVCGEDTHDRGELPLKIWSGQAVGVNLWTYIYGGTVDPL